MFPDISKLMKTAEEQGSLANARHDQIVKQNERIIELLEDISLTLANGPEAGIEPPPAFFEKK